MRTSLLLIVCLIWLPLFAGFDVWDSEGLGKISIYGNARMGLWWGVTDEKYDPAAQKSRIFLEEDLYSNSRFGVNFITETMRANVELKLASDNVGLRHAWGEYIVDDFAILAGQTYTGFSELAAQASSVLHGYDGCFIKYGAGYDGRLPQVRLTWMKAYLMMLEPVKVAPDHQNQVDAVDAPFPKINIGYRYEEDGLYFHPTFGLNISYYNPDFSANQLDETVLAFAGAATMQYHTEESTIKAHVFFGQNVGDYGIVTAVPSKSYWNAQTGEIENVTTVGGYAQLIQGIESGYTFAGGVGFVSSDSDDWDSQDAAFSAFAQVKIMLHENLSITPEIGLFSELEDKNGVEEGSVAYFGTKLQADF